MCSSNPPWGAEIYYPGFISRRSPHVPLDRTAVATPTETTTPPRDQPHADDHPVIRGSHPHRPGHSYGVPQPWGSPAPEELIWPSQGFPRPLLPSTTGRPPYSKETYHWQPVPPFRVCTPGVLVGPYYWWFFQVHQPHPNY